MKQLKYSICTFSPVLISSESGNQFMVPTKDYIPGINILGVLAGKYIKQKKLDTYFEQEKPSDQNFLDWFINGGLSFSNAYKVDYISEKENGKESTKDLVTSPLPFSVHHIKNDEGNILDLFYQTSDKQTKPFGGFGLLLNNNLYKTKIPKSTSPHHERNYDTGAVKQGRFYNYESIAANQEFAGTISGNEKNIAEFYNYFKEQNELRIGRSRTSEYGKVKFFLSEVQELPSNEIKLNNDGTISLIFLSNVIIYNKNGFPSCSYKVLQEYLAEVLPEAEIKKAFLRTEEIENYISVWRLKKPSEVSFQLGSCLLLKINNNNTSKLRELQDAGIGERKHEGFGQIAFGLQKKNGKISKAEFYKEEYNKPSGKPMPVIVTDTVKKIAQEYLQKAAAVEALNIVYDNKSKFKGKITSSQVSRLEGFVRVSHKEKDFKDQIDLLRKLSKEKLNACDFAENTLLHFLINKNILNDVEGKISEIETLFKDVSIDVVEINPYKESLFKIYYLTFFAAMRKALKGGD